LTTRFYFVMDYDYFSQWRSRVLLREMEARKILGVDRNAKNDEIQKAYRKLAKKYHPDKNPNKEHSHHQFVNIGNAYKTLIKGVDLPLDGEAIPGFIGLDSKEYFEWWKERWGTFC